MEGILRCGLKVSSSHEECRGKYGSDERSVVMLNASQKALKSTGSFEEQKWQDFQLVTSLANLASSYSYA